MSEEQQQSGGFLNNLLGGVGNLFKDHPLAMALGGGALTLFGGGLPKMLGMKGMFGGLLGGILPLVGMVAAIGGVASLASGGLGGGNKGGNVPGNDGPTPPDQRPEKVRGQGQGLDTGGPSVVSVSPAAQTGTPPAVTSAPATPEISPSQAFVQIREAYPNIPVETLIPALRNDPGTLMTKHINKVIDKKDLNFDREALANALEQNATEAGMIGKKVRLQNLDEDFVARLDGTPATQGQTQGAPATATPVQSPASASVLTEAAALAPQSSRIASSEAPANPTVTNAATTLQAAFPDMRVSDMTDGLRNPQGVAGQQLISALELSGLSAANPAAIASQIEAGTQSGGLPLSTPVGEVPRAAIVNPAGAFDGPTQVQETTGQASMPLNVAAPQDRGSEGPGL